jgi:hypothetical protein
MKKKKPPRQRRLFLFDDIRPVTSRLSADGGDQCVVVCLDDLFEVFVGVHEGELLVLRFSFRSICDDIPGVV